MDPSEAARTLSTLRRRTTITCEQCGQEAEVWLRKPRAHASPTARDQTPRTCSPRCRQALYRARKREASTG